MLLLWKTPSALSFTEPHSPWGGQVSTDVGECVFVVWVWECVRVCVCLCIECFRSSDKVHLERGLGSQFRRYHSNQKQTQITWSQRGSQSVAPGRTNHPRKSSSSGPRSQRHSCWIFHGVREATKPTVKNSSWQSGAQWRGGGWRGNFASTRGFSRIRPALGVCARWCDKWTESVTGKHSSERKAHTDVIIPELFAADFNKFHKRRKILKKIFQNISCATTTTNGTINTN